MSWNFLLGLTRVLLNLQLKIVGDGCVAHTITRTLKIPILQNYKLEPTYPKMTNLELTPQQASILLLASRFFWHKSIIWALNCSPIDTGPALDSKLQVQYFIFYLIITQIFS